MKHRNLFNCLRASAVVATAALLAFSGCDCTDEHGGDGNCPPGESWNPVTGECVVGGLDAGHNMGNDVDGNGGNGGNGGTNQNQNQGNDAGGGDDVGDPCVNLECQQVACPVGSDPTTLTGRVTIPSGTLPLADVLVYVPNGDVEPVTSGVSCERCEDQLTGEPLVQAVTDLNGEFELVNVPVGQDIPVVIQIGKWRRQLTVDVNECQSNRIANEDLTRLPRNRSEGDIPQIAVSTGEWDALECLVRKIGIDDSEITTGNGNGAVHLYAGTGGTNRFNSAMGGESFINSQTWWDDLNNFLPYDIVILSCEGSQHIETKPMHARQALQDFTELGGRVFLSHWHNVWLQHGPADGFAQVANWSSDPVPNPGTGYIDTSFDKGQTLHDWMQLTGGTTTPGQFQIFDTRGTVGSIQQAFAQRWIWVNANAGPKTQYFSFNTPVGAPDTEQCGRVVFRDIHVSVQDTSSTSTRYPDGCSDEISPQEQALIFMFFDLSACIVPDCTRLTCDDVPNNCGVHPDNCGSTIDCGICCVDIGEECTDNADCCEDLWCDPNTDRCTDRCRVVGEECQLNSECCTNLCAIPSGAPVGSCVNN